MAVDLLVLRMLIQCKLVLVYRTFVAWPIMFVVSISSFSGYFVSFTWRKEKEDETMKRFDKGKKIRSKSLPLFNLFIALPSWLPICQYQNNVCPPGGVYQSITYLSICGPIHLTFTYLICT